MITWPKILLVKTIPIENKFILDLDESSVNTRWANKYLAYYSIRETDHEYNKGFLSGWKICIVYNVSEETLKPLADDLEIITTDEKTINSLFGEV